jgi:hypothetical protein
VPDCYQGGLVTSRYGSGRFWSSKARAAPITRQHLGGRARRSGPSPPPGQSLGQVLSWHPSQSSGALMLLTLRSAVSPVHAPKRPSTGRQHLSWLKLGEMRQRAQKVTLTWFHFDLTPEGLSETIFEGAEHDGAAQMSLSVDMPAGCTTETS